MGDVAMTVPVVYSLATQYPNLRITVLSKPFARAFFENLAPNVNFWGVDLQHEIHGVCGLNTLYRRLADEKFTHVADFHDVLRSKYLRMCFWMNHTKVAHINKHRSGKRKLVSQTDKRLVQQPTSFQNYADVLAQLGYATEIRFQSIFATGGNELSQLGNIGKKGPQQKWIGIAPFAAHEGKIYPLDQMQKVIGLLGQQCPDCRIFLFGGSAKEKELLDEIAAKNSNCTNVSTLLGGLGQELILMSYLDVMVSMDSANMHMASLTGTPVVSVWGATHPFAGFMGWNQSLEDTVQVNLPCRPCSVYGNKPCKYGDFPCLKNITPEMVASKVVSVLSRQTLQ